MTRPEKEAEARRLRASGLMFREIAERMGVAISTVDAWLNDPGGVRLRERKDSYRGRCVECGGPTYGGDGTAQAPERCAKCIEWTPAAILEVIREWSQTHGRAPRMADFRDLPRDTWPCAETVRKHFGSWNQGLLRAGCVALNKDNRPETQAAIEDALRRGERVVDIASRYGITTSAIYQRLRVRGVSVAEMREAA